VLGGCYVYAPAPRTAWDEPPRSARPPPGRRVAARHADATAPREPPPAPTGPDGRPPEEATEVRSRIVEVARRFVDQPFAGDCSGYVRRVLRDAEVEVGPLPSAESMSASLHLASRAVRRPHPGDLVFFHDTYDRNRDGKLNDEWTHVALVEAVDGDQVWFLHRGGRGILRLRMNLAHPHDEALNDPVRARRGDDPPGTRYLSGELFSAYGAVVE
jgi:hypothetical protein